MGQELIILFQNLPMAGAVGLIGFLLITKILSPLVLFYINRKNGTSVNVANKIKHFENNCLTDIDRRLKELEQNDIRIEQEMYKLGRDVSWLKGRLNNKP